MLLRKLSLALIFSVAFINEGHGGSPVKDLTQADTARVRRTPENSPIEKERQKNSPLRRQLALLEYNKGSTKNPVDSCTVRKVIGKFLKDNSYQPVQINKKYVIQNDELFDVNAKVMNDDNQFETNLQRMQKGLCPISYRGIAKVEDITTLTNEEIKKIKKKQIKYRVELQHMTQKDTGKPEDPIIEMSHVAHHGKNARLILKWDRQAKKVEIIASSKTKKEALAKLRELNDPDCFMVTNVLHFRKGKSLINRDEFDPWRENYWKTRAAVFEPKVVRSLFSSLEETEEN